MTIAWRPLVAVVVAALLVLTSCTSSSTESEDEEPSDEDLTGPHLLGVVWSSEELETAGEAIEELQGGRTVRTVTWCDVEPTPGTVSFDAVDEDVTEAQAQGYEVFLRIKVGQCWATTPPPPPPLPPGETTTAALETTTTTAPGGDHPDASKMPVDLGAYAAFVGSVAQRYSPTITHFAVEQDVNERDEWDATFDEYAQLVPTAGVAIKSVRPAARIFDGGVSSDAYGYALADALLRDAAIAGDVSPAADPEPDPNGGVPPPNAAPSTTEEVGASEDIAAGTTAGAAADAAAEEIPEEVAQEMAEGEAAAVEFYNEYFARRFEEEGTPLAPVEDAAELRKALDTPRAQRAIVFATGVQDVQGIDGHALTYSDPAEFLPDVTDWVRSLSPVERELSVWALGVFWPGDDFDEDIAAQELAKELALLLAEPVDGIVFSPLLLEVRELEDVATASEAEVATGLRGLYLPTGLPRRMSAVFVTVADLTRRPDLRIETIAGEGVDGVVFGSEGMTRIVLWSGEDRPVVLAGDAPADTDAVTINGEEVEWVSPGLPLGPEPVVITMPGDVERALRTIGRRLDQAIQDE